MACPGRQGQMMSQPTGPEGANLQQAPNPATAGSLVQTLCLRLQSRISHHLIFLSAEGHEFSPQHLGSHGWRQHRADGRPSLVKKAALARWWGGFL